MPPRQFKPDQLLVALLIGALIAGLIIYRQTIL